MKILLDVLLDVLIVSLLILGFLSPYVSANLMNINNLMIFCASALIASFLVGFGWFQVLKMKSNSKCFGLSLDTAIDDYLGGNRLWLQGIRSRLATSKRCAINGDESLLLAAKQRFFTGIPIILGIVAICLIPYILLEPQSKSGLFGSLLNSALGVGLAVSFLTYLAISSLAFFTVGVLSAITWRK